MKTAPEGPVTTPPPVPYVAPQLTRQGEWRDVTTLVTSIPVGPGNFGLPSIGSSETPGS